MKENLGKITICGTFCYKKKAGEKLFSSLLDDNGKSGAQEAPHCMYLLKRSICFGFAWERNGRRCA